MAMGKSTLELEDVEFRHRFALRAYSFSPAQLVRVFGLCGLWDAVNNTMGDWPAYHTLSHEVN